MYAIRSYYAQAARREAAQTLRDVRKAMGLR